MYKVWFFGEDETVAEMDAELIPPVGSEIEVGGKGWTVSSISYSITESHGVSQLWTVVHLVPDGSTW